MIEELVEALKNDKTQGSYYYSWQANIAVAMQDAYEEAEDKTDIHKISNDGAKRFLDLLIKEPEYIDIINKRLTQDTNHKE